MTNEEASNQFDVLFNNITSNQAPGLNEYEKSVFLTSAQEEVLKNHYDAQSKGNTLGKGFDESPKRQIDFSNLIITSNCTLVGDAQANSNLLFIDPRAYWYTYPTNVFIPINESILLNDSKTQFQVIPLSATEYQRLMSKPYKRPLKHQAWKLQVSGDKVEVLLGSGVVANATTKYSIRYLKRPRPIILGNLDDLTIGGDSYDSAINAPNEPMSEVNPILHEEILQRAVEKAKIAWGGSQEEISNNITSGTRSE